MTGHTSIFFKFTPSPTVSPVDSGLPKLRPRELPLKANPFEPSRPYEPGCQPNRKTTYNEKGTPACVEGKGGVGSVHS